MFRSIFARTIRISNNHFYCFLFFFIWILLIPNYVFADRTVR